MKTTIDIPDELYRQLKARSALEGRRVREVAISLFDAWVHEQDRATDADTASIPPAAPVKPSWFGALHR